MTHDWLAWKSCVRPIDWWQIWWPKVNLWPFFREQNFSTTDISHTFCRSTMKFGSVRGLSSRYLLPEFHELWSGGPMIPCDNMHQSFTDTLVKWFLTTSPCLSIVLVFFLFTALPEDQVQAFCTSASRDSSLRQHSFLVCVLVTMMRGAFDTVVYQCLSQHILQLYTAVQLDRMLKDCINGH